MENLKEFDSLREEILQNQNHVIKALEFGLLITSGFLALSYSTAVSVEVRWLSLLTPSILLVPFILLQIERIRSTWIMGRYIEFVLEPALGFHWEDCHRHYRLKTRKRLLSSFASSSALPLIIIQIVCILLSFLNRPTEILIWVLTVLILFLLIAFELLLLFRRNILAPRRIDLLEEICQRYKSPTGKRHSMAKG